MDKKTTADRLRQIMYERGIKQSDILESALKYAADLGIKMNRSDISQYVNGKVSPSQEKLTVLSKALGVSEPWLMGYDVPMNTDILPFPRNALPPPKTKRSPIRGDIACEVPMLAVDEIADWAQISADIPSDFSLRCHGDSMIGAHILNGDLAHIKAQPDVENGQIAAVEVEGEATLKRVRKIYNKANKLVAIELLAENPSMPVIRLDGEDMSGVHIAGLLVGVTRLVLQRSVDA